MILEDRIQADVSTWRERVNRLTKEHGDFVISNVTVSQIFSGIRGVPIQVSDISYVDPEKGIRYRGYTINEILSLLPKLSDTNYPLVGGVYHLLMGNELPTMEKALAIENEWKNRSEVPDYVFRIIDSFPENASTMAMYSAAILSMSSDSKFSKGYHDSLRKEDYWKAMLDDSLDLTARSPQIAAYIYNKKYRNNEQIGPDKSLDYAANFAHMIGKGDDPLYADLMRLFILLHADHENANVSAHTAHLVGSALSDIYLSCSAGLNGLAGPLHGLANQECFNWLLDLYNTYQGVPTKQQVTEYIQKTLDEGKVIPGYGHAVLRCIDPRFEAERQFAEKYFPDDEYFRTAMVVFETAPDMLKATGKVKNPWPNVDALNGTLQYHFGVTQSDYYTVLFGLSRMLGFTCHIVWARALGKPIERPKALTTRLLESMIAEEKKQEAAK
jgi:citrate synthase